MSRTSPLAHTVTGLLAAATVAAGLASGGVHAMVPAYRPVTSVEQPIRPIDSEATGVGRLVCLSAGSREVLIETIGWVVGGSDTVVTEGSVALAGAAGLDPASCLFELDNPDGSLRVAARIRHIHAPWSDGSQRDDEDVDYSVVKLDRVIGVRPVALTAIHSR